jgi:hypothetical protein
MNYVNPYWTSIERLLRHAQNLRLAALVAVAVFFPAIESFLTNKWTSASADVAEAYRILFFGTVAVHAIVAMILVLQERCSEPQTLLARAHLLHDEVADLRRELVRRHQTNEMVREAFDLLRQQTCTIEYSADRRAWCFGGFHRGLEPILRPFLDRLDVALGVRSGKFTLEVYFEPGIVSVSGREEVGRNGLCQVAFYGTHKNRCDGVCMDKVCSPAGMGYEAARAFTQHIEENRHVFFDGTKVREKVYFRRYAVCPINESCSNQMDGVLVLTSMQDEPFADNALETLAFLATLVSHYHSAYQRCFEMHQDTWGNQNGQLECPDALLVHVSDSSTEKGSSQVLKRENEAWNGGKISVRSDKVFFDGAEYPLISRSPIHARFQHQGKTIEITE